ncbi:RBBP9/YdeN family alpha/beta hydrolase [Xylophilus sp. GOD-11R]|uniref:RBBP9/YdeN family alpha/beta hydrolase n=1 Tax=Xylophilus sp. GOD-11R TaxID=3089814 RepID=UPI00298C0335|nr:alpha/beta hydrolase [Xylophilus sp. GOD-11R]WPB56755.1 alpha/beta hydrolase [Xylophilus sp. GOD-11R]
MTQRKKAILIPGNGGGSTHDDWFPYVAEGLRQRGCEVVSPGTWPDPMLARAAYWLPYLEQLGTGENTILVGFSSGAIAAMRHAERHRILGSILVAGYHTTLGIEAEVVSGYFDEPWQWERIRGNQRWIVQLNSPSDPFIPIEEARFLHRQLQSDYHEVANRGHFYPMTEFPELLAAVERYL